MAERTPPRRAESRTLIHELNRRYHREWVRAELLRNELTALQNSRLWRLVSWLPRLKQRLFPPPPPPGLAASAEPYPGFEGEPAAVRRVSIVIPFRDRPELLQNCLRSLTRTAFRRYEIVLVDNGSTDPRTRRLLGRLACRRRVRVVDAAGSFNFSRLCNAGADAATGGALLFLNNDTEVLDPDWLGRMVALATDPAVGVVGATLLYPDFTVQHAGLFPRTDGTWVHPHRGERWPPAAGSDAVGAPARSGLAGARAPTELQTVRDAVGARAPARPDLAGARARAELQNVRCVPAVTAACLLVRRAVFEEVGGFDEAFPVTGNDADLCARVRAGGRRVLISPDATLIHYEGLTRGFTGD